MLHVLKRRFLAVIYDNDDTAQAPEIHYYLAMSAIAAEYGKYFAEDSELRRKVMGIHIREVARIMIGELGLPLTIEEWLEKLKKKLVELAPTAEYIPGFIDA